MPIPVINTTTSVLEGTQWQPFNYQPFATNAPTGWSCDNLPAGLTIDEESGLISGTPEVAGVFVVGLVAENGDGDSAPLVLTIGIAPGIASQTRPGIEVDMDLQTFMAELLGGSALHVLGKLNKDILIWLRFKKQGVYLDLDITELEFSVREFDPDVNLVVSSDWKKFGSGSGTYYAVYARVSGSIVEGALGNYDADDETQFDGRAEFRLKVANPDTATFGPEEFEFASRNFPITLATSQA